MFVSAAPSLDPLDFIREASAAGQFPAVEGSRTGLFSRGCDALAALLRAPALTGGQGILVPSYLCREVVNTFESHGVPLALYGIDGSGRFDPDEVVRKITPRIRAIYVVHYFGFPQQVGRLREIADAAGVILIEDCAHALFGRSEGRWLGEFGDAAVFSLRKTLPLPDGGALLLNNSQLLSPPAAPAIPAGITAARTARLLAKSALFRLKWRPRWRRVGAQSVSSARIEETAAPVHRMSATAGRIYRRTDVAQITERRRANFAFYLDRLGTAALYKELPSGVVPFSFPVLVHSRDDVAGELARRGLSFNLGFPEAPVIASAPVGDTDLSGARLLARQVLELPVHQDLSSVHLEYVIAHFNQIH